MTSREKNKISDDLTSDLELSHQKSESLTREQIRELLGHIGNKSLTTGQISELLGRINLKRIDAERKEDEIRATHLMQHDLLPRTRRSWVDLPVETLLRILDLCFESVEIPFQKNFRRNPSVWTLSWTCSSWRNLILNEPLFWSNIHARFRKRRDLNEVIHEVLRRGQQCPLILKITGTSSRSPEGTVRRFLRALLAGSTERLSVLSLDLHPSSFGVLADILPQKGRTCFPSARELCIEGLDPNFPDGIASMGSLLSSQMPNLARITVVPRYYDDTNFPFLDLEWTRFSHVAFNNYILPTRAVHRALASCDKLTTLYLIIGRESPETVYSISPSMPRIHLPALKSLRVRIDQATSHNAPMVTFRFLVLLDLPAITKLALAAHMNNFGRRPLLLLNILSNHICTLKSLQSVELMNLKGAQIDNMIASLPNLKILDALIPGNTISRLAIEALEKGEWNTQLHTLNCAIAADDFGALAAMLERQWCGTGQDGPSGCLKNVLVYTENSTKAMRHKYRAVTRGLREAARAKNRPDMEFDIVS